MCSICEIDGRWALRHSTKSAIKDDLSGSIEDYFASLVQAYMPSEKKRRRNVGTNKARAIADKFVGDFESETKTATHKLVTQEINTDEWMDEVEIALMDLYLNGAAAAMGYLGKVNGDALKDVENKLMDQEEYLKRFKADLDRKGPDKWDEDKIMKRVMLYAPSSVEVVEKSLNKVIGRPELPFYPKQSSLCRHNCKCQWKWKTINKSKGQFEVTWVLNPDVENCETCLARAAFCAPLIIDNNEVVSPVDFDEMIV